METVPVALYFRKNPSALKSQLKMIKAVYVCFPYPVFGLCVRTSVQQKVDHTWEPHEAGHEESRVTVL